jgi:hypothetical protein
MKFMSGDKTVNTLGCMEVGNRQAHNDRSAGLGQVLEETSEVQKSNGESFSALPLDGIQEISKSHNLQEDRQYPRCSKD